MKKTIYFVRHGQSEGNISDIGNLDHSPLSKEGRMQAEFLAKRCAGLSIQTIITSNLERSKETSKIINSLLATKIESSELFAERRKPTAVIGKTIESPEIQKEWRSLWDNFHIPGFRHSDEENFDDLKIRAIKALGYLASRNEETMLVVSHGIFMKIIAATVIIGNDLTGQECVRFMSRLEVENTSVSVFKYDSEDSLGRNWMISTWNDQTHLGE